jgi:hypothetical protein
MSDVSAHARGSSERLRVYKSEDLAHDLDAPRECVFQQLPLGAHQPVVVKAGVKGRNHLFVWTRFGQEAEDLPLVDRLGGGLQVVAPGEHDANRIGGDVTHSAEEHRAGHSGHALVGDDYRERPVSLHCHESLDRADGGRHLVLMLKQLGHGVEKKRLVVDEQDSFRGHGYPASFQ